MASPKSGKAGTAVSPDEPGAALEADDADPGKVAEAKAEQLATKSGKYGATPVTPYKPPKTAEEKEQKKSWIEIKLVDDAGKPVAGESVEITLSDKTLWSGSLDQNGFVRVDGIPSGQCEVVFPKREKSCWKPQ